MSGEVVRSYSPGGSTGRRRRRGRGCGGPVLLALFGIALLVLGWVLYTTRDAMPMHRVVSHGQAYRVLIPDLLHSRAAMADSPVWRLAGDDSLLAEVPGQLSANFGLPPWIVNNTLHGLTHISGDDVTAFTDWLGVVRMTRIGVLLERLRGFSGEIEPDHAGGLELRAAPRLGMHYAVRGRLLLVSPSRDVLIRALTLTPEDAIHPDALRTDPDRASGEEVLFATATIPEDLPGGAHLAELRVGVRLVPEGIRLRATATPRPGLLAAMPRLLAPRESGSLPAAAEGPIALSFNLGAPLAQVWPELRAAFPSLPEVPATLDADATPLARLALGAWKDFGGAGWASWVGVAPQAMFPVPQLLAGITTAPGVAPLLAAVPQDAPVPASGIDLTPRRDPESAIAYLDFVGGPDLAPAATAVGEGILLATSRSVLERALDAPPQGNLPQPGLAYLRFRPHALATDLAALGRELAAMGLFLGLDLPGYDQAADAWQRRAAVLGEVAALLHGPTTEGIRVDLEARFNVAN